MLRFIKQLLGHSDDTAALVPAEDSRRTSVTEAYFTTMFRLQEAVAGRNFEEAGRLVRENLRHLPQWVNESRAEYETFDISSIPALQQGGTVLALLGDDDGLAIVQKIVASDPDLAPWAEQATRHLRDRVLFQAISEAVVAHPNCRQTSMKKLVGEPDGRRIATLIGYLEKAGRIVRIKDGSTFRLLPAGSPDIPAPVPKPIVSSHRVDRQPPKLREIDLSSLSYIPLPPSPPRWEERQGREKIALAAPADEFEIRDAPWSIASVEAIPMAQRPDIAFRLMHPTASGLFMVDDLGNAAGLGVIAGAAMRYDRAGKMVVQRGLDHDIYRIGVHPLGNGFIAMSRACVVHAYDDQLRSVLCTALTDAPEIVRLRKRFGLAEGQLKNHIRCVALSRHSTRYLFTAVDEAWCVDLQGHGLWGVKLSFKEGWTRAAPPSESVGTSADIQDALRVMDLSLPFSPQDLKRRFRELAKKWHPDLNPNDPGAGERMKLLTSAAEILTGFDASAVQRYMHGDMFERQLSRDEIQIGNTGLAVTLSISMQVSEAQAADWIYAAGFAANSEAVYLAGYSGRVVLVDPEGKGVRVFDVGAVPRRIVDTGDYLYLLTDTRLYVLHDDVLHAVVDVFDGGELVMAETGFGLLENKRLRLFNEDGTYLGSILSRDPIRRVYAMSGGMVVETRTRRANITGVPAW